MSLAKQILALLEHLDLTEEDGFETGLDVAKKRTIKGKLEPSDEWRVTRQWSVHDDGDPENPDYETCANCGKDIAYCVDLTGPQDVTVGADCAISLTSGAAKEAVESFIKNARRVTAEVNKEFKKYQAEDMLMRKGIEYYLGIIKQENLDATSIINGNISMEPKQRQDLENKYGRPFFSNFVFTLKREAAKREPDALKAAIRTSMTKSREEGKKAMTAVLLHMLG